MEINVSTAFNFNLLVQSKQCTKCLPILQVVSFCFCKQQDFHIVVPKRKNKKDFKLLLFDLNKISMQGIWAYFYIKNHFKNISFELCDMIFCVSFNRGSRKVSIGMKQGKGWFLLKKPNRLIVTFSAYVFNFQSRAKINETMKG